MSKNQPASTKRSRPATTIHFEIEVLYETTYTTACGATPTIENATPNDAHVTCLKCLAAMGYDVAAQLEEAA